MAKSVAMAQCKTVVRIFRKKTTKTDDFKSCAIRYLDKNWLMRKSEFLPTRKSILYMH
jgi:hypothetical protein